MHKQGPTTGVPKMSRSCTKMWQSTCATQPASPGPYTSLLLTCRAAGRTSAVPELLYCRPAQQNF